MIDLLLLLEILKISDEICLIVDALSLLMQLGTDKEHSVLGPN